MDDASGRVAQATASRETREEKMKPADDTCPGCPICRATAAKAIMRLPIRVLLMVGLADEEKER